MRRWWRPRARPGAGAGLAGGAPPTMAGGAAPGPAARARASWLARLEPRPATLSAEDDDLLASIAGAICRRGLATPAVLWLESLRPLSYLGSQALRFCEPFAQPFLPAGQCGRLAGILEERGHLERLVRHVEAAVDDAAPPAEDGGREAGAAPPAAGGGRS